MNQRRFDRYAHQASRTVALCLAIVSVVSGALGNIAAFGPGVALVYFAAVGPSNMPSLTRLLEQLRRFRSL